MGTRMEVTPSGRSLLQRLTIFLTSVQDPCGEPRSLSRTDFVDLAWSSVGHGSREEYGLLFDVKAEGRVDWTGLCHFLLLELSEKMKRDENHSVPRWKPPRSITCPHRDPVQKVLYLQSSGQYLTMSRRGTVGLRDKEDTSLVHTHRLQNGTVAAKDLWATDAVLLPNVHKMAVSFTSKEVCFYDTLSEKVFSCRYKLQGLKFTPWCMDYWADVSQPDRAVLTIGDIGGQVTHWGGGGGAVHFTSAQISLFERPGLRTDSDSVDIVLWDELVRGKHRCCYLVTHQVHAPAWVRKVRYLDSLEAFVSCSTAPQSSMVIGWKEKESRDFRVSSFSTKRGVWDLDHHRGLNLMATAGVDHQVLLWNPYLTSEPLCALSGHANAVLAVRFLQTKQQLLSYSKDKVLCLWDVSSQQCLHRLSEVFPRTQEDTHTLMYLHEERHLLLLSFNSTLVLLESVEEERRGSSHAQTVTCVLYNSLFRQVVSSDSASSVICWQADTGQKVKQFHRCHGDAGILTMALDGTQTRLFTAGTDGEVKVWDFSGGCLHRMNAALGRSVPISQVLLLKRSVVLMGWERYVSFTVFRLHSFSQSLVEPSKWRGGVQHGSPVLCAAFQRPHTLVTGSYGGEIVVWNHDTEQALRRLQTPPDPWDQEPQSGDLLIKRLQPFSVLEVKRPLLLPGHSDCLKNSHSSSAITRLFFIPGRTSAAAGGADLVSCGGSGVVRFWNSVDGRLLGHFTAHNKDLGSMVMTLSPCGGVLVTADGEGRVKTWEIQRYLLQPDDDVTADAPDLRSTFRPHRDRVTHLETFVHGDRLLLLSASSDCSVSLSHLSGDTVGRFGQVWKHTHTHSHTVQGSPEVTATAEYSTAGKTSEANLFHIVSNVGFYTCAPPP
uniref:WD repeat domain 49 n=1 Tax=Cynoglossus semilaevis TaxID=244447 RepID=A0A3P8UQV2_CYNSE